MRIISGIYKHKEILSPNSVKTHPMGDRERLALFNMLGGLEGLKVLDAFAGTGALGLEALSRGAGSAMFVEKDGKTAALIKKNLENLGPEAIEKSKVMKSSVESFKTDEKFDLIFADPPYGLFNVEKVLPLLTFLNPGGRLVLSSPKPVELPGASLLKTRTYARCIISIFVL